MLLGIGKNGVPKCVTPMMMWPELLIRKYILSCLPKTSYKRGQTHQ